MSKRSAGSRIEELASHPRRGFLAAVGATAFVAVARGQGAAGPKSPGAARAAIIDDLVTANHILYREGIVDAFGHVSARSPGNSAHYLMAAGRQPPLVGRADIVELDLDSKPVAAGLPSAPLERFIHGEIYRLRPDVMSVVHSHAEAVLPFGVTRDMPLRAVCHTCGFIGSGAPVFEIRDVAGDGTNLLVQNNALGIALARTLGAGSVVLMRGHGFAVAGASIREAVYNAINTVRNAHVQLDAQRLGSITYLTDAEAAATSQLHNANLDRSWEIWARRARGELP